MKAIDPLDQAQELTQHTIDRGVAEVVAKANAAANNIKECVDCLDEIPEERKAAVPSAKRCSFCQEIWEKRHA